MRWPSSLLSDENHKHCFAVERFNFYLRKLRVLASSKEATMKSSSPLLRHGPVVLLLVSSIVLNVALATRILQQSRTIRRLTPPPLLPIGALMSPIAGKDLAGNDASLVAQGKETLLYVFAPKCSWCLKNAANMRAVMNAARVKGMVVYGLSLDPLGVEAFLEEHGVVMPVLIPSQEARKKYGLGGTPQTIVLGPDGRVLKNWVGAYAPKNANAIAAYFRITLPGLTTSAP